MNDHSVAHHEYVIIGSGPAGLQMSYFLKRRGRDHVVLERNDEVGSFFSAFPRHGQLISINKVETGFSDRNLNLRWDWNSLLTYEDYKPFKEYDLRYFPAASSYVTYLKDFANAQNLPVQFDAEVHSVSRASDGVFHLMLSNDKRLTCDYLVVATGFAKSHIPSFPGIEHTVDYRDMSLEIEDYRGKKVLIIGKSNSAFETADHLNDVTQSMHLISPDPVKLAWQSHYVGNLRAVNSRILDTYQLKAQNTLIDGHIEKVEKHDGKLVATIKYIHAMVSGVTLPVDIIITCTGFKVDTSIFDDSCRPDLCHNGKFPDLTSEWESSNVGKLYFLGPLMHGRDYRKTFSGFVHGYRYNIESLDRILSQKYHDVAMPKTRFECKGEGLPTKILERIHTSANLFQQPKFLCDVVHFAPDGMGCDYFSGMPLDYIFDAKLFSVSDKFMTITMEYGEQHHADPFALGKYPSKASESNFLHPVLRVYEQSVLVTSFHLMEDLENYWYQPIFLESLATFFQDELGWRDLDGDKFRPAPPPDYESAGRAIPFG
ncbi:MAG: NAD(P)-binding domain-containing protein [Pseudomonadota bacterium]